MYTDKTQLDSRLDLTLYIEGLFQRDDAEIINENALDSNPVIDIVEAEFPTSNDVPEATIQSASEIPAWGQDEFKCLIIKSAGMNFMIPAMSVSYIERVNKKIIRIPIETDAFHGVISLRDKSLAVVDLFKLITEDTENDIASSQITSHHVDYVLVFENDSYALACDQVSEIVTLNTEDVRWNGVGFFTPLYAGVVKESLCPLINIDKLQQQISIMPFIKSLQENNY